MKRYSREFKVEAVRLVLEEGQAEIFYNNETQS
jgi:transposase-like protein